MERVGVQGARASTGAAGGEGGSTSGGHTSSIRGERERRGWQGARHAQRRGLGEQEAAAQVGMGGRRRAARAGKEGGREKEEKEKKKRKKKERKRERERERKRERERERTSAILAAATVGPDKHMRRSGGTQRVARNEGEQGDGMVIDTGVGTADRREKFWGVRNELSSVTKRILNFFLKFIF